jgi:arylsulfatase A-like enzyme
MSIACGFAILLTTTISAAEKPNVIAIVTDDQGQWAVGAYGNRDCQTPHLDRIAREGALFPNAFTCTPVCSPSRATYLSGHWPTEVKITDYLTPAEAQDGLGVRTNLSGPLSSPSTDTRPACSASGTLARSRSFIR